MEWLRLAPWGVPHGWSTAYQDDVRTWTWGPPEAPSASMVYSALGWIQHKRPASRLERRAESLASPRDEACSRSLLLPGRER